MVCAVTMVPMIVTSMSVSMSMPMPMVMVMMLLRYNVDDQTHSPLSQTLAKSVHGQSWILKMMQSHADGHEVKVRILRSRDIRWHRIGEQITVAGNHLVAISSLLDIGFVFIDHVFGDIQSK